LPTNINFDKKLGKGSTTSINFSPSSTLSFINTLSTLFDGIDTSVTFSTIAFSNEFTTSFWFKPISVGVNSYIIGRDTAASPSDYVWLRTIDQIRLRISFLTYTFLETNNNNINVGAWNHLLICRDFSNNVTLYLNNQIFSSPQTVSTNHRLEKIGNIDSSFYDGLVNNVAFWNSDQTANRNTIYGNGSPRDLSELSPLLWYRMGENDIYPTISDNAGSNDATMVSMSAANFVNDVP
jgi:hypothetical protein